MQINITQEDIDVSIEKVRKNYKDHNNQHCTICVVATALERTLKTKVRVAYKSFCNQVLDPEHSNPISLPYNMRSYIHNFDNFARYGYRNNKLVVDVDKVPQPISFEVSDIELHRAGFVI